MLLLRVHLFIKFQLRSPPLAVGLPGCSKGDFAVCWGYLSVQVAGSAVCEMRVTSCIGCYCPMVVTG